MTTKAKAKRMAKSPYDAFLSHSSADLAFAHTLAKALEADGLDVWFDEGHIEVGELLRDGLQAAIQSSRTLVLFWSAAAQKSRWVMAEIFTAFHSDRLILPIVLDDTPLPEFLARSVFLDLKRDGTLLSEKLGKAVRGARSGANRSHFFMGSVDEDTRSLMDGIGRAQYDVMAIALQDREKATQGNQALDTALETLVKLAAMHPMTLNLQGYQCKNKYLVNHWDTVQMGRKAEDPLLEQGERYFFDSLSLNPNDVSAVNGLGSILILDRELNAAEFFVDRAIELMKSEGMSYEAAETDKATIQRLKGQQQLGAY